VAGGDVVHILTRRASNSPPSTAAGRWDISTVRVNQFEEAEWPHQELATLQHFSIGEEQSESTVVALALSSPGLGIHRRSVLAVLTSNLVLSLWESNGTLGEWRRTGVVNHSLNRQQDGSDPGTSRRRSRIRAFTWLPPLFGAVPSKWGRHHLALADDTGAVLILSVGKKKQNTYGQWSVEVTAFSPRPGAPLTARRARRESPLASILRTSSAISKLEASEWESDHLASRAMLRVAAGQGAATYYLKISIEDRKHEPVSVQVESVSPESACLFKQTPSESIFQSSLQKPCREFNEDYKLGGRYRVRFWGTTYSFDNSMAAACVTLHPSDMIEYTTPSVEKSILVFVRLSDMASRLEQPQDAAVVQQQLLTFIAENSRVDMIKSALDENIITVSSALTSSKFTGDQKLRSWSLGVPAILSARKAKATHAAPPTEMATDSSNHMDLERQRPSEPSPEEREKPSTLSAGEQCDICAASIPFTPDAVMARCCSGHQFIRCNLCFVAIQEPGISKYCPGCGRQFLDLDKLESLDGPSLSQALFDQFDVCPYCQAHFRG